MVTRLQFDVFEQLQVPSQKIEVQASCLRCDVHPRHSSGSLSYNG
jgi:hypothetical protein